jgi:sec-independent protein translocase protein TatA
LGFLDIGWAELLLILVVVLIIFGPGRMVEISRSLGKTLRAFKNASSTVTTQISREIKGEGYSPGQEEKTSERPDKPEKA